MLLAFSGISHAVQLNDIQKTGGATAYYDFCGSVDSNAATHLRKMHEIAEKSSGATLESMQTNVDHVADYHYGRGVTMGILASTFLSIEESLGYVCELVYNELLGDIYD